MAWSDAGLEVVASSGIRLSDNLDITIRSRMAWCEKRAATGANPVSQVSGAALYGASASVSASGGEWAGAQDQARLGRFSARKPTVCCQAASAASA